MRWKWFWIALVIGFALYRLRSLSRLMRFELSPQLDMASIVGIWACGIFIALFILGKLGIFGYLFRLMRNSPETNNASKA